MFSFVNFQNIPKSHALRRAFLVMVFALASCVSCTKKQTLKTEDILTLGPILDYEFSPDEQLVAVLLSTDAIAPGSDRYLSIMRSNVGSVGIFIFDLETQETLARSDASSDTIENLRWSHHNNTIFYLDRGDDVFLISWQLDTDKKEITPFQHGGFDIAPNDYIVVAWDKPERAKISNVLTFYTWPQLDYIDSLTLSGIEDIDGVQWSSDGSWLFINTSSGMYQLDLDSHTPIQIDPVLLLRPDLNASDTLVAYDLPFGDIGIYSLEDMCIVKEFDNLEYSVAQPEWGLNSNSLHLVLVQSSQKQHILARLNITDSAFPCLVE